MRRTLTIVAVIVVLLGVIGAVYFFFFYHPGATVTIGTPSGVTTLPSSGQASTTYPGGSTGTSTVPIPSTTVSPFTVSPRLVKITSGPVVPGMVVVDTKLVATSSPIAIVKYIDRQSGNVYAYSTESKTITRTSNKTVPGIQSAAWLPDGSLAYVRYLSGTDATIISTYGLRADGSAGFFLNQDIADISVASTSVLTLASGVDGSVGVVARADGSGSANVFTSPLSMIRASFAGKGKYLVFTKPSSLLAGDAFLVTGAGRFSRIAGPYNGLVALASPSGKWVLVSFTDTNAIQMELINTTTSEVIPLPVATLVDKCVWTTNETSLYCGIPTDIPPNAHYPDDWYQGAISFTDRVWRINIASRYAELVLDFSKETKTDLDATALAVNPLNTTLVFVNKNDSSLWSYSI